MIILIQTNRKLCVGILLVIRLGQTFSVNIKMTHLVAERGSSGWRKRVIWLKKIAICLKKMKHLDAKELGRTDLLVDGPRDCFVFFWENLVDGPHKLSLDCLFEPFEFYLKAWEQKYNMKWVETLGAIIKCFEAQLRHSEIPTTTEVLGCLLKWEGVPYSQTTHEYYSDPCGSVQLGNPSAMVSQIHFFSHSAAFSTGSYTEWNILGHP